MATLARDPWIRGFEPNSCPAACRTAGKSGLSPSMLAARRSGSSRRLSLSQQRKGAGSLGQDRTEGCCFCKRERSGPSAAEGALRRTQRKLYIPQRDQRERTKPYAPIQTLRSGALQKFYSRLSSDQSGIALCDLRGKPGMVYPRTSSCKQVRPACQEGRNEFLQIVKHCNANSRQALFSAARPKWKRGPLSRPGPWSRRSPRAGDRRLSRRPAWP